MILITCENVYVDQAGEVEPVPSLLTS